MDIVTHAVELFRKGNLEGLKNYCERVLPINNTEVELWKLYGIALAELGNPTTARFAFNAALKLDPEDQVVLCNLITSFFHEGDRNKALELINGNIENLKEMVSMPLFQNISEALDVGLIDYGDLSSGVLKKMKDYTDMDQG